jgi:hypothetical protein
MSDVTVAPPGAAPSAAPTPSNVDRNGGNEVVINQNPTSSPNPIGSQAPSQPTGPVDGSKHHPVSRAESLRNSVKEAFDRANNPPPKGERPKPKEPAKAAEAKPGHNNPPEPTEGINLKKRPVAGEQPQRGEHGHFAPRTNQQPENQPNPGGYTKPGTNQQPTVQGGYKRLPSHAPYALPPMRFSEGGKRDWADASENIRGDVHRMHNEYDKAYQQYRGAAEAFKPIARFHQMAQAHGTTLEKALTNYTGIEQRLRTDPIGALDVIINNLGLVDPQSGQRLGLRDVAYSVLSQSPEQLRQIQQGNQQTAASHQIGALHQEIQGLKSTLQQMHTQQQFVYTRSAVDQYAASHPRFDELGAVIEQELKLGFDIDTAYRRAELLYPATHAAQTRTASAQTRPADRSIHGNPDVAPSNGASRRPSKPSGNVADAVQNAFKRANGHV